MIPKPGSCWRRGSHKQEIPILSHWMSANGPGVCEQGLGTSTSPQMDLGWLGCHPATQGAVILAGIDTAST